MRRRLERGQCYSAPYFGTREFPAHFKAYEGPASPEGHYSGDGERDLGLMLYDMDYADPQHITPVSYKHLLRKYPDLRFIDNPLYDKTNNISSAALACSHFQNAYVFESDLLPVSYTHLDVYKRQDIDGLLSDTFNSTLRIEERSLDNRLTHGLTITEVHTIVAVGLHEQTPMNVVAERLGTCV